VALSDIRGKIATVLSGVTGIGTIHAYERWCNNWNEFLALYKTTAGIINGGCITRIKTPSLRDSGRTLRRDHTFLIRYMYGLKDSSATELTFQALVEAIQTAFDSQYTLGGNVLLAGPLQVIKIENRLFGTVLCHYAEMQITAWERVSYS